VEEKKMKNFRTYQLAMSFYQESQKIRLRGPMKDQFERAVLSIPLNLAEGSAKPSAKERRKFYRIALGSLREVQCLLELSEEKELFAKADILAAHLYSLCIRT
jgi:four helix bundle protein